MAKNWSTALVPVLGSISCPVGTPRTMKSRRSLGAGAESFYPCSSVRPHKRSDANLTRLTPARNVNANPNIVRVHPWFSLKLFEAEAQRAQRKENAHAGKTKSTPWITLIGRISDSICEIRGIVCAYAVEFVSIPHMSLSLERSTISFSQSSATQSAPARTSSSLRVPPLQTPAVITPAALPV